MSSSYLNPSARRWVTSRIASSDKHTAFHKRCFPNYVPTPLVDVPSIAKELRVGRVLVKDESSRLGLPAFKILGASWAILYALCERFELDLSTATLADLLNICGRQGMSLWAATDGNHGRAVAKMAAMIGARAFIYVPKSVSARSQEFIMSEGAEVIMVDGDYDQAVRAAAKAAEDSPSPSAILIQDTAWDGYEAIPMEIVIGYTTMFTEIDEQLHQAGLPSPTLVVVPVGVGSLAHAALLHYRSGKVDPPPSILTVEPEAAACLLTSLKAGKPTTIVTGETIMAGLNCGTVSSLAWPDLVRGVDAATKVSDQEADKAVYDLAALGVSSGPCGAATIAALRSTLVLNNAEDVRKQLEIREDAIVVVISSESSQVYLGTSA